MKTRPSVALEQAGWGASASWRGGLLQGCCVVLFFVSCLPTGRAVVNYCCNKVDWSDKWCTRDDCFGLGCRKGENGVACPRTQECPCKELVSYKTRHKCLVEQACAAVVADVLFGKQMVELYRQTKPTQLCSNALTRTMCAYHFPMCENDVKEHKRICSSTCNEMERACGITLPYISAVGDRCQNLTMRDQRETDPCTSSASALRSSFIGYLCVYLSLGLILSSSQFTLV